MSDSIHTFFAAWGESDADKRGSMIADCLSNTFYYADPNTPKAITSAKDFTAYLAMFTQSMPEASAKVLSISAHNNHARATIDFMAGAKAMMRGQYFAELDDSGKVSKMIGFTGTGEG